MKSYKVRGLYIMWTESRDAKKLMANLEQTFPLDRATEYALLTIANGDASSHPVEKDGQHTDIKQWSSRKIRS